MIVIIIIIFNNTNIYYDPQSRHKEALKASLFADSSKFISTSHFKFRKMVCGFC